MNATELTVLGGMAATALTAVGAIVRFAIKLGIKTYNENQQIKAEMHKQQGAAIIKSIDELKGVVEKSNKNVIDRLDSHDEKFDAHGKLLKDHEKKIHEHTEILKELKKPKE